MWPAVWGTRQSWRARTLAITALFAAAGCGVLVDGDVGTVALLLPQRTYYMDAGEIPVSREFWNLRCGAGSGSCCARFDCSRVPLQCEEGACVVAFTFESWSPIDVRAERLALKGAQIDNISLRAIEYSVRNDSNFNVPEIDLYLAPFDITSAADGKAEWLGRMPATPAGMNVDKHPLELSSQARALFNQFAEAGTTFNVIINAPVRVSSKSNVLKGEAELSMVIELEAQVHL